MKSNLLFILESCFQSICTNLHAAPCSSARLFASLIALEDTSMPVTSNPFEARYAEIQPSPQPTSSVLQGFIIPLSTSFVSSFGGSSKVHGACPFFWYM